MGQPTSDQVAQRAFDLGLLDERQLREVWAAFGRRNVPLNDFLQLLVRREFMTNYQVERLVKGERSGFFYGPYKVLFLVGSGTFARVYRAVHRHTGEVVAIKALRSRYSDKPEQYNQFLREGQVGITLRHPNIVPIYDAVSEGKVHYLVMEYVEGCSLRDFVKIRKVVDPLQATRLMIGMADGLQYALEHGLTHRDLKLSNVLVSSAGQPKLVDFGLAAMDDMLADDTLTDVPNARTIDYAALERATGVRKDDTRSDVYFLGCIFYHMLIGQAPLSETKDRLQRLSKNRFTEVVPVQKADPTLPHWVFSVVNRAMSLDPTRRYQSPAAMLNDLRLAETQLIAAGPSAPPSRAPEPLTESQLGRLTESQLARRVAPPKQYSVMVVESNHQMQDVFREGFKRAGYRVLVLGDPVRAVTRFRQDVDAADCVVFNAQELGEPAVAMFNALGEDKKTSFIRAILLLDATQREWEKDAHQSEHRVVLPMPITMKELRNTLAKLVGLGGSR